MSIDWSVVLLIALLSYVAWEVRYLLKPTKRKKRRAAEGVKDA